MTRSHGPGGADRARHADETALPLWRHNTAAAPHRHQSPRRGPGDRDLPRLVTALVTAGGALVAGWLAISQYQRGALVVATLAGTIALLGLAFVFMALFRWSVATSWGFWFSGVAVIWGGLVIPTAPVAGSLMVVTALLAAILLWNGAAAGPARPALLRAEREWGGHVRRDR